MPKMKTNGGAKKRFRVTGTGKISHKRAFLRHNLVGKNAKRRRRLGQHTLVHTADEFRIKKLLVMA